MIVTENIFVMLLEKQKFSSFTSRAIADRKTTEVTLSFACQTADEVKSLSQRAFELGATRMNDPEDLGFMFSWGFEDLDGHMWDLFWMNPDHLE